MIPYASVAEAEEYFKTRLHSRLWFASLVEDRTAALITATRQIDRLRFNGCKTDESQENQFPRYGETEVRNDIKIACMEVAFELLSGKDPQKELENLTIISQGFSNVRNTQDRSFVHEHLNAGIVSQLAWAYIRPYLRDDQAFIFKRVS